MQNITKQLEKSNRGFALISALLIMSAMLLAVLYLTADTSTETKISASQVSATKNYYLAESALNEAVWRLNNDSSWKDNFEKKPNWKMTYTRNPALYPGSSYTIEVNNIDKAKADITVTAYTAMSNGKNSKRVIKASVYEPDSSTQLNDKVSYSDGNIDIYASQINFQGDVYSNNNIFLSWFSTVNVNGTAAARTNIHIDPFSYLHASSTQEHADSVSLPAISFDTAGDSKSYKSRANNIYTQQQFDDLMWHNQNLTLNGITYVTGNIDIRGAQRLNINGVLVASGDITIGENTLFCCRGLRCGLSTVNLSAATGSPAGILAKGRIDFELCLDSFQGRGLVYAADKMYLLSLPQQFNLTGGLVSRKLDIASIWKGMTITLDKNLVALTVGSNPSSQSIVVDHWEEEY